MNMTRKAWLVSGLVAAALCGGSTLAAQDNDAPEANQAPPLAQAVLHAPVSLERGLTASVSHGRPISAKFEMEDGKLQLSVYTVMGGKFFEVIVDHTTGKVVKAESITDNADYAAAQSQSAAMAKTKGSLARAVEQTVRSNAGFRAVGVIPSLKGDRPLADVTLTNGEQLKAVTVPLQ